MINLLKYVVFFISNILKQAFKKNSFLEMLQFVQ